MLCGRGLGDILPDKVESDEATDAEGGTDPVHRLGLAGRLLRRK